LGARCVWQLGLVSHVMFNQLIDFFLHILLFTIETGKQLRCIIEKLSYCRHGGLNNIHD
jgi:hypothetical protein